MPTATVEQEPENKRSRTKNPEWRASLGAPADWVAALLGVPRGRATPEGVAIPFDDQAVSVLVELRCGRRGSPMLVEAVPFNCLDGIGVHDTVVPLALDCWEKAREKVQSLPPARYDSRIRVIDAALDGTNSVCAESDWTEVSAEEGDDVGELPRGRDDGDAAGWITRLLASQNSKLFSQAIQILRSSGFLLQQAQAGHEQRITHDFATMEKFRAMAQEMVDRQIAAAKEEADAKEVEEFARTARHWMSLSNESKLAKEGVKPPSVPTTRRTAAVSLWNSLTMGQLECVRKELGDDRADQLLGLMRGAKDMSEDQIAQVFEGFLAAGDSQIELMGLADKVFSTKYVSSAHAIWQSRACTVLLEGPAEKSDG